jgi:hypothetical protein
MQQSEIVNMKIDEAIAFINRLPLATKEQKIRVFNEFIEQSKQNVLQRQDNMVKFKDVLSEINKGGFKLKGVVPGDIGKPVLVRQ